MESKKSPKRNNVIEEFHVTCHTILGNTFTCLYDMMLELNINSRNYHITQLCNYPRNQINMNIWIPFSLSNFAYKIVSKVITAGLEMLNPQ